MNSKFNMKSVQRSKQPTWEWSSKLYTQDYLDKEKARADKIRKQYSDKKKEIESRNLKDVLFRDVYTFPFKSLGYSQVYDNNDSFIFQFEINNKETVQKCLNIINGDLIPTKENSFVHAGSVIYLKLDDDRLPLILIRGWGNLTGSGAYNLKEEYACKIQDTLAEYIVEKLTFKKLKNKK